MAERGREKFNRYKKILFILLKITKLLPLKVRVFTFNHIRMIQGNFGIAIRYVFLKSIAKEVGDNVSIHPHVYIYNPQNLIIGNNVSIHSMAYIESSGGITIGNDVSIAHGVTIMSESHNYSDPINPIKDQGLKLSPIEIKDNVWIGAKSTILSGIIIETGSIVGAGAVVTKDIEIDNIVAGVPAKAIKMRV